MGSVFVPCLQQVGSSGIQLGLIGCLVPYCVEHWYDMGSPNLIILLSIGVSFIDLIIVQTDISKHIHMVSHSFFQPVCNAPIYDSRDVFCYASQYVGINLIAVYIIVTIC